MEWSIEGRRKIEVFPLRVSTLGGFQSLPSPSEGNFLGTGSPNTARSPATSAA